MSRRDHRDERPHVLVIEDVRDELGEVDYVIEHLETCPKELWASGMPDEYYTCRVEWFIGEIGLRESLGVSPHEPFPLAPGRYEIIGCSTYDDYTHESDIWIEPHPDPSRWTTK